MSDLMKLSGFLYKENNKTELHCLTIRIQMECA